MRLIIESKYPHPFKTKKEPGDSEIIYETGQRTTDISKLGEKFNDLVEETEGTESKSWNTEVSLDLDPKIKKVPVTKGTYPTEYNYDKKVLSSNTTLKFRPTAAEVLNTARTIVDDTVRAQLLASLFLDPIWLDEVCELMK